jgi:hypothetical protein
MKDITNLQTYNRLLEDILVGKKIFRIFVSNNNNLISKHG